MTTLEAQVHLTRSILRAVDGSDMVICGTSGSSGGGGSKTDAITQDGTFRQYATGVTRLSMATTNSRTQNVTLRALPATDVEAVKRMAGKTCLYRDTYGRRIWGAYTMLAVDNIPLSDLADVSITFTSVTYNEAV